jgi:flagellar hook-length control protein FliK
MPPSTFAVVLGPITGSTAPSRGGKADVRPASINGEFAAALKDAPTSEAASEASPIRPERRRDGAATASETVASDAEAGTGEVGPVVAPPPDVSAPVAPVLPPVLISAAPEGESGPGVAAPPSAAPGGEGDGPGPATPASAPDFKALAGSSATQEASLAHSAKAEAPQSQTLPSSGEVPTSQPDVAPAEPKVVSPPATDRAREVAAARSAVITSARPARAATPVVDTATPPIEGADASSDESDASPPVTVTPAPVESGRVRDVIDRAALRAATDTASAETDAPASGPGKSAEGTGSSSPGIAAPKPPSPIEAAPLTVPATLVAEEPATPQAGAAPSSAPEAQRVEAAQTTGLSSLSRTAVETTAQIAAQILRRLEGRSTRFEMALTPEGLGRVDISLDIEADGSLRATLAFDNPVAATDLRGRADELRRQLTDAGFTLADDALSFADRDPSAGQGGGFDRPSDRHNARAFGAASRLSVEADGLAQAPSWIQLSLTPTGVDMKV